MRRILLASIVLAMLLTACAEPDGDFTQGIYEFNFTVEQLSGWAYGDWDFVYTYNGEKITNGHTIAFSLELFSFHCVRVDIVEKGAPDNSYSDTFPVALCDGGSGKTEIAVTGSDGRTATFKITCDITQTGKQ